MAAYLDSVPFSGIIRVRDMMFSVKDPYRLDQGDISFDSPDSVKSAMVRAIAENKTHYVQTTGIPKLREVLAGKMREKNRTPVEDPDQVLVTNGGIHGLFLVYQALLEPGEEVLIPDPAWPPALGCVAAARGVPIAVPLHESLGWRYDLDELEAKITPRTRVLYINSPNNPSGGVLTRADLERLAAIARERNLWVISDEAYEDVVFEGEHISIASLPGMYERTIPLYTFSKSYAMTGLRLGYIAVKDAPLRERVKKLLFFTASNVSTVVQWGGVGAVEGPQDCIDAFRTELLARRDLFYRGLREFAGDIFSGKPPAGALYGFPRINPSWAAANGIGVNGSMSWQMAERLIKGGRIGCVPGVDFGANGEGCIRFCFARDRREIDGALRSMKTLFESKNAEVRS